MNTIKNTDIRYYYIRSNFKQRHPVACVCLLRDNETGKCYRGISVCSMKENSFSKVIGRGVAYGNAVFAYSKGSKLTRLPKALECVGQLMEEYNIPVWNKYANHPGVWMYNKADPDAVLTSFERKMMDEGSR